MNDLDEYQRFTLTTAEDRCRTLEYLGLGLAGEAGEVAGKLSKRIRGDDVDDTALAHELGDVLWFLARLADQLGFDLSDIANANVNKLRGRQAAGTIRGNGDNR